jgi:class 3 adenylate cyclase
MYEMTQQTTYQTTVIFADVAGSSRLYKQVGDREANRRVTELVREMAEIVTRHGGVVIKTIGDEVMAHIVNPTAARDAAVAIQRLDQDSLPVRIGMAWGDVIEKDSDLFGQTVNDAAAVAKIARGGQVITTREFHQQLDMEAAASLRMFDRIRLKGGQSETEIYRVEWRQQDADQGDDHTLISRAFDLQQDRLKLLVPAPGMPPREVIIGPQDTPFTIGRNLGDCELAIPSGFVSREHCQITHEHGKFVVRDHSSNGTHISTQFGQSIFLRRGDFPLTGSGVLAIGHPGEAGESHVIGYEV